MAALAKVGWVGAILAGIAFIVLGVVFIALSNGAKDEIRTAMIAEDVTTGDDAAIPNVLVQDVETARAEEAVLAEHTLGRYGPNRASYLKGLTMRNSLNLSIMGFGVADLALGVGVVSILMGASTLLLTGPALFALRRSSTIS